MIGLRGYHPCSRPAIRQTVTATPVGAANEPMSGSATLRLRIALPAAPPHGEHQDPWGIHAATA